MEGREILGYIDLRYHALGIRYIRLLSPSYRQQEQLRIAPHYVSRAYLAGYTLGSYVLDNIRRIT